MKGESNATSRSIHYTHEVEAALVLELHYIFGERNPLLGSSTRGTYCFSHPKLATYTRGFVEVGVEGWLPLEVLDVQGNTCI